MSSASVWADLAGGLLVDPNGPRPARTNRVLFGQREFQRGGLRLLTNMHNQEETNSCVAHGMGGAIESYTRAATGHAFQASMRQIWWNGRAIRGQQYANVGMFIDDVAKIMASRGIVPDDMMPWTEANWSISTPPSAEARALAEQYLVRWEFLTSSDAVIAALTNADGKAVPEAGGRPVPFGFPVGRSYYNETARDGIVRPLVENPYDVGWHCEYAVLYDPSIVVGRYGPGGIGVIGSWEGHGIPHPDFPDLYPNNFKWFPRAWFDDWDRIQFACAPLAPLNLAA